MVLPVGVEVPGCGGFERRSGVRLGNRNRPDEVIDLEAQRLGVGVGGSAHDLVPGVLGQRRHRRQRRKVEVDLVVGKGVEVDVTVGISWEWDWHCSHTSGVVNLRRWAPPEGGLIWEATLGEDSGLIARAVDGDELAFAVLLADCRGRAWAVCYRICGNHQDAEDALQEAAVAAWRHVSAFRGAAQFSTWFCRIAANAALQLVRRRRDTPTDALPEPPAPGSFTDRVEAEYLVRHALAQLRPEFRAALVLREWGDLSYADIAEWQGVPVQTVKSRLNRARNALAQLLADAV